MSRQFNSPGEGILHQNFDTSELTGLRQNATRELMQGQHHFGVPLIDREAHDAVFGNGLQHFTVDGVACYIITQKNNVPKADSVLVSPPDLSESDFLRCCRDLILPLSNYVADGPEPLTHEMLLGLRSTGTLVVSGLIKATSRADHNKSFISLRVPTIFAQIPIPPRPDGRVTVPRVYANTLTASLFDWFSSVHLGDREA